MKKSLIIASALALFASLSFAQMPAAPVTPAAETASGVAPAKHKHHHKHKKHHAAAAAAASAASK